MAAGRQGSPQMLASTFYKVHGSCMAFLRLPFPCLPSVDISSLQEDAEWVLHECCELQPIGEEFSMSSRTVAPYIDPNGHQPPS